MDGRYASSIQMRTWIWWRTHCGLHSEWRRWILDLPWRSEMHRRWMRVIRRLFDEEEQELA